MAAAPGNQYAAKERQWRMAIERALDKRGASDRRSALDDLAGIFLDQCAAGEGWALKELADRLDGKVPQAIVGAADHPPVQITLASADVGL